MLGNRKSFDWLVQLLRNNDINKYKSRISNLLNNTCTVMSDSKNKKIDDQSNTRSTEMNDYIKSMIQSMLESTRQTQFAVEDIGNKLNSISSIPRVESEVNELMDVIRTASQAMVGTLSLYGAISGILTYTTNSLTLTNKKLSPVLQTEKSGSNRDRYCLPIF